MDRTTTTPADDDDDKSTGIIKELVDGGEQVLQWLDCGKMDAKHLAKMLPLTAQDLMDGKTTKPDVLETLKTILMRRLLRELSARELSNRTIPEIWCRNDEQKQWWAQAQQEFQNDLFKRFDIVLPSCIVVGNESWIESTDELAKTQNALQQTCTY